MVHIEIDFKLDWQDLTLQSHPAVVSAYYPVIFKGETTPSLIWFDGSFQGKWSNVARWLNFRVFPEQLAREFSASAQVGCGFASGGEPPSKVL